MSDESTNIAGYTGYTIDRTGVIRLNGEIKYPRLGADGYYAISLKNSTTDKYEPKRIKDLLAMCYLPKDDPRKKYLGTKDKDRKNHSLENLIWRTPKEHGIHSASIPIDTSETRECKVCEKNLPMSYFPLDNPNKDTGVDSHRRHHCQKCISKARAPPTPEQMRKKKDRDLKVQYGISLEEYDAMFKAQDGKCLTCMVDISGKTHSHVDHCHSTKKVRGLLCPNCNKALGLVGDSITILQALTAYLQKHSATPTTVQMPVYGPRVTPPKTGDQHANSGVIRSEATRAAIATTKKADAAKKFETTFKEKLEWWISDPTGDKQKSWRHSVSRKYHDGNLPETYSEILEKTSGWTFSKGTPHTTNSRVQKVSI